VAVVEVAHWAQEVYLEALVEVGLELLRLGQAVPLYRVRVLRVELVETLRVEVEVELVKLEKLLEMEALELEMVEMGFHLL
jgi:hypothetical protein